MKSFLLIFIFISSMVNFNNNQVDNYVPDAETAIKIAEAIWLPIYGEKIMDKKPYKAILSEDGKVWIVKGTIQKEMLGGYPIIEIRKSDCKILKVSHGK
jgi:hypothetical protein